MVDYPNDCENVNKPKPIAFFRTQTLKLRHVYLDFVVQYISLTTIHTTSTNMGYSYLHCISTIVHNL